MQARSEGLWPRATEAHAIRTLLGIATLWRVKRSEQTCTACSRFELIIRVALLNSTIRELERRADSSVVGCVFPRIEHIREQSNRCYLLDLCIQTLGSTVL